MQADFDVFISYAHTDAEYAKDLLRHLEREGVRCTMDRHRLSAGAEHGWRGQLEGLITRSSRFLMLMTPRSVTREEVFRECHFADSIQRPIHVLQVQARQDEPLPAPSVWTPGLSLLIGPRHRECMHVFNSDFYDVAPKIKSWLAGGARRDSCLTSRPDFWIDRSQISEELAAQIHRAWNDGSKLALMISGPSGAGKSRLADDVCDALNVEIGVRRMRAHSEIEHILPGDVLFVDACLGGIEDESREITGRSFAEWFQKYAEVAPLVLLTSRHPEAYRNLSRVFRTTGHVFNEYPLGGLTYEEFKIALKRIESDPDARRQFTDAESEALYASTGGLPLCLQLILDFIVDLDGGGRVHTPSPSIADSETCQHLIAKWRDRVARDKSDWETYLYMMSNVPILGMDCHAAALCLDWEEKAVAEVETQMMRKGLIHRIDAEDGAYQIHDLIRIAFSDSRNGDQSLAIFRRRYRRAAEANFLHHNGGPSKSILTLLDALQVTSRQIYLRVDAQDFDDMGKNQASRFLLALNELQSNSFQDVGRLEDWFVSYVKRTFETLKPEDCAVLLAIGPICERLPKKMVRLGDAFAPFWESGTLDDVTKINSAIFPSLHHWSAYEAVDREPFIERLVAALGRQPWRRMDMGDLVAAGFACAIARLGKPSTALTHVIGNLVRGEGQPTAAACAGILLCWVNGPRCSKDEESLFPLILHNRSDFLRSLDPLVGVYLKRLGLPVGFEPSWGKVEFNPNRALLLGEWANNVAFQKFVRSVCDACEVVRPDEPHQRATISELQALAAGVQPEANGSWRGPLTFGDPDFRPHASPSIRSAKDLDGKSTSQTPPRADEEEEVDASHRSADPSESELPREEDAPVEMSEVPSEPTDFSTGFDAEKPIRAPPSPQSEELTRPAADGTEADRAVSETVSNQATNSGETDEELTRLVDEEQQRAYVEATQRSKREAESERNAIASRKAVGGPRAEGRHHKLRLLCGWFRRRR